MKSNTKLFLIIVLIGILSIFHISISEAQQQEKISPTLERGIGQYKHENYDEALTLLKKARDENPESTLAAYYLGLTYKQLQNYKDAIPHLKDAVTFSPNIKGALIELIDCFYQAGQLEDAKTWIKQAEEDGIRPAQVSFLKGLVLIKAGDGEGAIAAFKNAKELDKSMTQTCDYQIGIAHLKMKNFGEARRVFEEIVIVDPTSNMANYANEYIKAMKRKEEAERPWKLSFGTAWQYDDNVVLKPSDASIATDITDEADSRQVYTAQAEYNHRINGLLGIKGQYLFYYAKQNDLDFYDMVSNTFALQPSLYFKKSLLAFPSGYSHVIVNDKAYLSAPFTTGLYNFMVGDFNMGQFFIKYQNKNYLWTPTTDDENRDSDDFGAGAAWYLFYAKNKGFVNLRYALNKEWTAGNNWEYIGNRISSTLLVPVVDKLNLTVSGDLFMQDFVNSHTTYNVYRNDKVYTLSTLIAYKFYKDWEIQLQYTFVKDDSNISVYDYDRNIYSAGIEFKF